MRIFTWVQLLWERKAPAGASSDRNIPIHRTPTHTSFNFMRHYCRDTKLGRLPLGFSWLQQREAWTRFRAGARTFLDGKVTYPPASPALSPYRPLHPQQLSGAFPLRCFPFSHGNPALKRGAGRRDPPPRGMDKGPGSRGMLLREQAGETASVCRRWVLAFGRRSPVALALRLHPRGDVWRGRWLPTYGGQGQKLETTKWELKPASFGHQKGLPDRWPCRLRGLSPCPSPDQKTIAGKEFRYHPGGFSGMLLKHRAYFLFFKKNRGKAVKSPWEPNFARRQQSPLAPAEHVSIHSQKKLFGITEGVITPAPICHLNHQTHPPPAALASPSWTLCLFLARGKGLRSPAASPDSGVLWVKERGLHTQGSKPL